MKVLVTGGTGVIGLGLIPALLSRGHTVRLLSRNADADVRQWAEGVEPHPGDVTDDRSLCGTAKGCDAVIHIAGIASEEPPDRTFRRVNVEGTANIVAEATASGCPRFLFVSSLGTDRGTSEYHASKRAAEEIVRAYAGNWTIVRPGNVYGPGDDVISALLTMVRSLPAVPTVDWGTQPFQPIWHEDLARCLTVAVERDDLARLVIEVAGEEATTTRDLVGRLAAVTGRRSVMLPVPGALVGMATLVASVAGVDLPIDENKLAMLQDGNVLADPAANGLRLLGIQATPLDVGLRILAEAQPEQTPDDGHGPMQEKRYWADIDGTSLTAADLMGLFRTNLSEIMPIDLQAESGATPRVALGETLTARLPVRGNIQMRVVEDRPTRLTFATVKGHPLAGTVTFTASDLGGAVTSVRFEAKVLARSGSLFDRVTMATVGGIAQDAMWTEVVRRTVDASGEVALHGIQSSVREIGEEDKEARSAAKVIDALVLESRRQANERAA
jgi:uncharacterized protein YbjT (DUF2867 family)